MEVGPHTVALTVMDYGCGIPPERLRSFLERNEGVGVGIKALERLSRLKFLLSDEKLKAPVM
jgi:hypothetical protein